MWLLVGELRRVIPRPAGSEGSTHQLQLLCEDRTKAGETRESIFTVGTSHPGVYSGFVGKTVVFEVSPFARKDGSLGVVVAEGAKMALAEGLQDTILDTRA